MDRIDQIITLIKEEAADRKAQGVKSQDAVASLYSVWTDLGVRFDKILARLKVEEIRKERGE